MRILKNCVRNKEGMRASSLRAVSSQPSEPITAIKTFLSETMRIGRRETKPATIIRVIAASSRSGSTVFPSFCGVLHAPPKLLRMVPADSTRELSDLCENCEHLQDGRIEEACFAETFSYIWIIRCTLERKWKR